MMQVLSETNEYYETDDTCTKKILGKTEFPNPPAGIEPTTFQLLV